MSSLPAHLSGHSAQGLVVGEPVAQFEFSSMRNFVYLLIDWASRKCAIIDSQDHIEPLHEAIRQNGLEPVAILITHTHFDHVAGLADLTATYPNAPVSVNEMDLHRIREPLRKAVKIQLMKDGDRLAIGALSVEVLHTPGHSLGECCFFVEGTPPYLFTGDTVFIRDCGRTDLPGGSVIELFDSIQRIKGLPPKTVILCGHHYKPEVASTLAIESVESPPFRCRNVEELEALP